MNSPDLSLGSVYDEPPEGRLTASDIVCLGMDAMRIALGMRPINFDADVVADFVSARAKEMQDGE